MVHADAVVWALKVKDADWELVQTIGGSEFIKSDEFRAMNPSGFVPVLKDGDFTLFERYARSFCIPHVWNFVRHDWNLTECHQTHPLALFIARLQ